MKQVRLKKVQQDLQILLDDAGEEDFTRVKALYLKDVEIVDSEGEKIDPDTVDVMIAMPEAEAEEEEVKADEEEHEDKAEEEEDKAEEEEEKQLDEKAIANIVRKELAQTTKKKSAGLVKSAERIEMKKTSNIRNFDSDENAYRFGRFLAAGRGHAKSMVWCQNNGIQLKGHTENVNSQGGYLVPDEFSSTLINLREQYGVARKNAHIEPMASDTKRIPRRSGGLTAYWTGEASAITESTATFDQVNLVAKKLAVITSVSNELNEDSLVNLGDFVAGEIAYQFAKKEDEACFSGDGSSTYGGIIGLENNIGSAGKVTSTTDDDTAEELILSDVFAAMKLLPDFGDGPNTKFYMHKQTWFGGIQRLVYAAGGSNTLDFEKGMQPRFMGYDVEFVNSMSTGTWATGAAIFYFGDLSKVAYFGDRRATSISFSDSALNAFEQDELIVRGTERVDIVTTNLGDSSEAGAMVALVSE